MPSRFSATHDGDPVGAKVGDAVGSEVVGGTDELLGSNVGDTVGESEPVGDSDGSEVVGVKVGSEEVGENDGDRVGSELVGL